MESGRGIGKWHSRVSDAELLRRIGHDLRSLYAEVIRQPLPENIQAILSHIEREQNRAGCQGQRVGV